MFWQVLDILDTKFNLSFHIIIVWHYSAGHYAMWLKVHMYAKLCGIITYCTHDEFFIVIVSIT